MSSIALAIEWLGSLVAGPAATTILGLAVALVGFELLTGRIAIRRGFCVVMGAFVLIGSAGIAQTLISLHPQQLSPAAPPDKQLSGYDASPRDSLEEAGQIPPQVQRGNPFDPYAGHQQTN
ncbi:TrbC/VirB2 family protein [Erythrobacter sp. GH1-10]|uniref:TrbC/VirB2 family protein n=1 Tax=Erythrobacter sp. GH1-10 TaxID=3349334 RepID=UPI003877BFEE